MAALRWLVLILLLASTTIGRPTIAQGTPAPNAAEHGAYSAALNTKDPTKRAQAMEVFVAWYPNSPLRTAAYEQAMAAWQVANNPTKADAVAARLLQIEPDNVRALANRVYVGRSRVGAGDASVLSATSLAAERGLAALAKWPKPESLDDVDFTRLKQQTAAIFNGALGYAALVAKEYGKAKAYYLHAVTADPDSLQDVYQLSLAQLEGTPLDPLGFWYSARAVALARRAKNDAVASSIETYARARYQRYHGSEEGWGAVLASGASGERQPPDKFAASISRALSPAEHAVRLVSENDVNALSYSDWVFVLSQRDESGENQAAAERLWRAIVDKQKGGASRLKVAIKVVSAAADRIGGAITDESKSRDKADLDVALARPLAPLPAVGATISIIGTIVDYRAQPFLFRMVNAELAPESLPVAGGRCADPRPQICTRDYRPACGQRRDGSRKTYGNACSACADGDVLSQAAGACP